MNKWILKILLLGLLIFIFFSYELDDNNNTDPSQTEEKNNKENIFQVLRVVDGDTVILDINKKEERVRLVGLNTPESKKINGRVVECFGKQATEKAKEILNYKKILFEADEKTTRDKYGRLLGYVFLEDNNGLYKKNFAEIMIKLGYGYEYTYKGRIYKYQGIFKDAQKEAQRQERGLWEKGVCQKK